MENYILLTLFVVMVLVLYFTLGRKTVEGFQEKSKYEVEIIKAVPEPLPPSQATVVGNSIYIASAADIEAAGAAARAEREAEARAKAEAEAKAKAEAEAAAAAARTRAEQEEAAKRAAAAAAALAKAERLRKEAWYNKFLNNPVFMRTPVSHETSAIALRDDGSLWHTANAFHSPYGFRDFPMSDNSWWSHSPRRLDSSGKPKFSEMTEDRGRIMFRNSLGDSGINRDRAGGAELNACNIASRSWKIAYFLHYDGRIFSMLPANNEYIVPNDYRVRWIALGKDDSELWVVKQDEAYRNNKEGYPIARWDFKKQKWTEFPNVMAMSIAVADATNIWVVNRQGSVSRVSYDAETNTIASTVAIVTPPMKQIAISSSAQRIFAVDRFNRLYVFTVDSEFVEVQMGMPVSYVSCNDDNVAIINANNNNVYYAELLPPDPDDPEASEDGKVGGRWAYMGCWKDTGNRAIPEHIGNVGSRKECAQRALARGANVMGLQYGGQCWIGRDSNYRKYGMDTRNCGELGIDWSNIVYKLDGKAEKQRMNTEGIPVIHGPWVGMRVPVEREVSRSDGSTDYLIVHDRYVKIVRVDPLGKQSCFYYEGRNTGEHPNRALTTAPSGVYILDRDRFPLTNKRAEFPLNRMIPSRNNVYGNFNLAKDYVISFDVTPTGTVGGWSNLFRFQLGDGDCCSPGQRTPALWFWPGNLALHLIVGDIGDGNWGIHQTQQLTMNKKHRIVITAIGKSVNLQIDNQTVKIVDQPNGRMEGTMRVFFGDAFYDPARCLIENFMVENKSRPPRPGQAVELGNLGMAPWGWSWGGVGNFPRSCNAKWIWRHGGAASNEPSGAPFSFFKDYINSTGAPINAKVYITADNRGSLILNDNKVADWDGYYGGTIVLAPGINTIEISALNYGGPAGLVFAAMGGNAPLFVSDSSWTVGTPNFVDRRVALAGGTAMAKFSPPPPPPNPVENFTVVPNTDFWGYDLGHRPSQSLEECAKICNDIGSDCMGFGYGINGGNNWWHRSCFPKKKGARASGTLPGFNMYVKK